jgi:protease YdgD
MGGIGVRSRLAAMVLLCAGPAAAEVPDAIGRISHSAALRPGAAICTGTLVAPDLVLTAGHCLGAGDPGEMRFALGADVTGARALRRGAAVYRRQGPPAPGPAPEPVAGLAMDLALIRLGTAVPADVARPLAVGSPGPGPAVMPGYRRDAPLAAPVPTDCAVVWQAGAVLGLGCPAVSGQSGAPVLQPGPGGDWQVVAVTVAAVTERHGAGQLRSLAVLPGPALNPQ